MSLGAQEVGIQGEGGCPPALGGNRAPEGSSLPQRGLRMPKSHQTDSGDCYSFTKNTLKNNIYTAPFFSFTHKTDESSRSALFLLKMQIPRKVMFHPGLECFLFVKDLFDCN